VEAARRGEALFLLNHGPEPADVPLPAPAESLLDGRRHEKAVRLAGRGAEVLVS
jgi:beta-galactosidase